MNDEETPVERATTHILQAARLARRGYTDKQILEIAKVGHDALMDAMMLWVARQPEPKASPKPKRGKSLARSR